MSERSSRLLTGAELPHSHEVGRRRLSSLSPPSYNPLPSPAFYSPSSLTFLFSHPYSLFLHICISLFSEVHCSLILRLRLLPQGPRGWTINTGLGIKGQAFPSWRSWTTWTTQCTAAAQWTATALDWPETMHDNNQRADLQAKCAHNQIRIRPI